MMKRIPLVVLIAAVLIATTTCGRDSPTTPTGLSPKTVMNLKVAGNPTFTSIGEARQFTATGGHADGTSEDITKGTTWQVADHSIGDFGTPGLFTSKKAGETTLTARYGQFSDTAHVLVLPAGTHILQGTVREPGFIVSGATVAILDGPTAGLSKTTDSGGAYKFYGLSGTVTVQVRKDGYVAMTQQVSMAQDQVLDFTLAPTRLPAVIASGTYRASFTASKSCTQLPDDAKNRTYTATLVQDGARLDVTLNGPGLNGGKSPTEVKFSGRVADTTLTFDVYGIYGGYYYYYGFYFGTSVLLDQLSTTRYLDMFGKGTGTIGDSSISGTLAGSFVFIDAPNGLNQHGMRTTACAQADHQFSFTPVATSGQSSLGVFRRRR
jgi:hypothetical protein